VWCTNGSALRQEGEVRGSIVKRSALMDELSVGARAVCVCVCVCVCVKLAW
jgi:hypothetical protein